MTGSLSPPHPTDRIVVTHAWWKTRASQVEREAERLLLRDRKKTKQIKKLLDGTDSTDTSAKIQARYTDIL